MLEDHEVRKIFGQYLIIFVLGKEKLMVNYTIIIC